MAYIFDLQLHKIQIPAEMPEWEARFPVPGPDTDRALEIVHSWRQGKRKLTLDEMPRELIARRPRKSWPDAFEAVNGMHVVSRRAKDAIESLDGNLHQFFPLTLRTKRNVEVEGPWFAMIVTAKQDSIQIEGSRLLVGKGISGPIYQLFADPTMRHVVVDPKRQDPNVNIWREPLISGSLLCSDALAAAFKTAGIKFFPHYRATDLVDSAGI